MSFVSETVLTIGQCRQGAEGGFLRPHMKDEMQRQKKRTEEILTEFSQICVNTILHQPSFSLEATKSVMKAIGRQHVADFLTRCFNGTEVYTGN